MRVVGPAPRDGEHIEIIMAEGAAAQRHAGVFAQRPGSVAAHLGDQRDACLSGAALSVRAPDAPHHRQHDRVPRGSGKSGAHRDASSRKDEIGVAERELAAMQHDLAAMLAQKNRLAALGLAVSKINHDLRNLLVLGAAVLRPAVEPAGPEGAALRAQADARARARHRVLPIDAVLWAGAGAAARPQADPLRGAGGGGARNARPRVRCVDRLDRGDRARPLGRRRSRAAVPHHAQSRAQCGAGAGEPGAQRRRARPAAHCRPARRRGGGDRGVGYRPRRGGRRRAVTCSRPSRARPAPAAPALASPSPPNSFARTAARSRWSTARSALLSASPSPTAQWSSAPTAARAPARPAR